MNKIEKQKFREVKQILKANALFMSDIIKVDVETILNDDRPTITQINTFQVESPSENKILHFFSAMFIMKNETQIANEILKRFDKLPKFQK